MTRIYKNIAIIASLVCSASAGESSVVESKISNNFMNSVEQVNTLDNTNTIDTVNNEVVDATHQRRELAWWNLVLQAVKPPCLPHHKKNCETGHGHCPKHCDHHSGGSGGGGSGGSGSGGGSDGATTTQKNHLMHPGGLAFWMMIAAASAAAIAIGAMIIGSRRKSKSNYHPLKGSLDRRMKLFGPMADGCFEDRELCGAQTDVGGDSANNMELSEGGSHYKEMV